LGGATGRGACHVIEAAPLQERRAPKPGGGKGKRWRGVIEVVTSWGGAFGTGRMEKARRLPGDNEDQRFYLSH